MAIRICGLSFGYARRRVLEAIDLDIPQGRFTVVLGKNGSGKSTLFRILGGFLAPDRGAITIRDQPAQSLDTRSRARLLGFLPQHHRVVFPFQAREVVLTGRAGHIRLTPGRQDVRLAHEAMARIGIDHLRQRIFTELSGGEQQLVMIARVLAQDPPILLFDEPTAHLDYFYQARVMAIIRTLVDQGRTVAAVLHDPNLAALYADQCACLKDGRVVHQAEARQLTAPLLSRVYDIPLHALASEGRTFFLPGAS
jgi:iron complex transport system ATP-binding protein